MSIFAITYDLNNQKNYPRLIGELEKFNCQRAAKSFWLGNFNNTTQELLAHFKDFVDQDDTLIFAKITGKDIRTFKALPGTKDWINKNTAS